MDTLVLDASYIPVARIHWQRALTLLFQGKVEVVEEYENREIRSVTFSIKVPSIIRFLKGLKSKKKAIKFSRENVYARDEGRCQYCSCKVPRPEATYDHVLPRAQGGKTEWNNIVIACMDCNQKKGNRTPEKAGMRLMNVPVRPKKLPNNMHITIQWRKGDPVTWRDWLATHHYWNDALEES